MSFKMGPKGEQVFGLLANFAEILLDSGNDLIIDEVLLSDEDLKIYVKDLLVHTTYFIGVLCSLKYM